MLTITFFLLLVYFAGFFANSLLAVAEHRAASSVGMFDGEFSCLSMLTRFRSKLTQSFCPDWFVSDHILVGEGIREAVAFVGHQLEESPWAAGRQLQMDRVLGTEDSGASSWFGFGGRGTSARREAAAPVAAPFWIRAIMHFTKGSALVGIVSVFYSFVGQSLLPPAHLRRDGTRR